MYCLQILFKIKKKWRNLVKIITSWVKSKKIPNEYFINLLIVIVYLFFIKSYICSFVYLLQEKINLTNKINDAFDFKIVGQIFDKKNYFFNR